MRRKRKTPYGNKALLATRNMLAVAATGAKYARYYAGTRYTFGTGEWAVSICAYYTGGTNILDLTAFSFSRLRITSTAISANSVQNTLASFAGAPTNRLCRITIQRSGTTVSLFINTKLIGTVTVPITDTYTFGNAASAYNTIGANSSGTGGATGLISNFVVLNKIFTQKELEEFHNTNLIPRTLHANVLTHIPLNQNMGVKAWDVVEQYNYAKVTALAPIHADLIGYSTDETGDTNTLLQTAWQNIYNKKKDGLNYLYANNDNIYGSITVNKAIGNFTIYFDFIKDTSTGGKTIFVNKDSFTSDLFSAFTSGSNIEYYFNGGLGHIVGAGTNGKCQKAIFTFTSTNVRIISYLDSGTVVDSGLLAHGIVNFEFFKFLRYGGANFGQGIGVGKFILIDGVITDRQKLLLLTSDRSDEYKTFTRYIDVDFGDVFLSGGNYFARDNSGNARHIQIFNWVTATDLPKRLEMNTRLPERRKALRFTKASSQRLAISGFNPTKELGYTTMVMVKHVAGGVVGAEGILSKRNGGDFYSIAFVNGTTQVTITTDDIGTVNTYDIKKVDQLNTIITRQDPIKSGGYYANQSKTAVAGTSIQDFNTIGAVDFYIGYDNGVYLDGHVMFVGIWKGFLSEAQCFDIANNNLAGNAPPSLMAQCQLYLNFEEIINTAGVYTIKDWSPQNRTVTLNNYTINEITPGDPAYKLFDLDTLR